MLCAKTLKAAFAAILGVVGLVGAGTAHAAINLNPGTATSPIGPTHAPEYFSSEKLAAGADAATAANRAATPTLAMATSGGYNVNAQGLEVALLQGQTYFLRFDLLTGAGTHAGVPNAALIAFDKAEIAAAPLVYSSSTLAASALLDDTEVTVTNAGGQGRGTVIYSVAMANDENIGSGDLSITWAPGEEVIHASAEPLEEVTYYLRLSIWDDRGDANAANFGTAGTGGSSLWIGGNSILGTKRTLTTKVTPVATEDAPIEADVANGFRRFKASGATTPTVGRLAKVDVNFISEFNAGTVAAPVMRDIQDPAQGNQITATDVLDEVQVEVAGNNGTASYNFGNFHLLGTPDIPLARTLPEGSMAMGAAQVNITEGLTGKIEVPGTFYFSANVMANTDMQMCGEAGMQTPCAAGMETYKQIEVVSYSMTLKTKLVGVMALQDEKANQPAGVIDRDGTIVRLAYLTTATSFGTQRGGLWEGWMGGSYNQRLVIVNHGSSAAEYRLGQFAPMSSEDAMVTVTGSDMATGTIGPNSSLVLRVRDLITIEGANDTSAVLTVDATETNVSVATTQVTLPEGQVDTVRYHPR